ncbi:uncharacterized protein C11orf97 homolog isoform X3 [Hyla sarda]|uniref:uncharacterized protein C11orf97 homolog isoform X3 n=1 Tax=Hyla sarda TaxID=327740 RepID=UPI0024C43D1E|nr:uncharacterized protein C11orf97 homolog isoform X3 [Hyla sarda]
MKRPSTAQQTQGGMNACQLISNMKRQPRSRIHGGDVGLWNVTSDEEVANECQEPDLISSLEDIPVRKHFFYVGTPKRIQELAEEEKFFVKNEIKVPSAIQLDKILKAEKNIQTCDTTAPSRNSFLTQPKHYSRHKGIRAEYPFKLTRSRHIKRGIHQFHTTAQCTK